MNNLEDNQLTLYTDYTHYQNNILELFGFEHKQDCTFSKPCQIIYHLHLKNHMI